MCRDYYTYRIRVANHKLVQVEKWNCQNQSLGDPYGVFRYKDKLSEEITELLQITRKNELNDPSKSRLLGEALFDVLFDDSLRQDFVNFYYQVVQEEKQLLRVELDIDERNLPEVAALPWEFMCLPQRANLGTIWLGTAPGLIFYRRRSQWIQAQPIQLNKNEKLKIALVVSAPTDLGSVAYEKVQIALEKLACEQVEHVELLPVVNPANPEAIDAVLAKKPHIFHFISHGRLQNQNNQEVGQIAFVDDLGNAMWVDADYFSELFNQHRPGVVVLQACEGGMLSASQAFVGVASRIVQQNIPVVVAMQYEVSNSTASRFVCCFYQQLAKGTPVDIAGQNGRRTIALSSTQYRKRDFATPVLFMQVRDGHLFKWEQEQPLSTEIQQSEQPLASSQTLIKSKQELVNVDEYVLPRLKLYGRSKLLSELEQKLLTAKGQRILLRGASGIGKSAVLTGLQASIREHKKNFICLCYEIESPAHSLNFILYKLVEQLLKQIAVSCSLIDKLQNALNEVALEQTYWSIIATLLKAVKDFIPNTISFFPDNSSWPSPRTEECILQVKRDDILAGFFRLLDALNANGIVGSIFLDRLEAGSEFVQTAAMALATRLPHRWGFIIAVNDELPQGLKTIEQVWPPMAYAGAEEVRLSKLDISALESWITDIREECPGVEKLRQVLKNCDGRPLFLRDWVSGVMMDTTEQSILNRVGAYYEQRIRALSSEAKRLLKFLAILPTRSAFLFEFCHSVLASESSMKTYEVLDELELANFLERSTENLEAYRFVHDMTQEYISRQLPSKALIEAAKILLKALKTCEMNNDDPYYSYMQLFLSALATEREAVLQLALPTATKLIHSGAYNLARESYELGLEAAQLLGNTDVSIQALIGIALTLYSTGHYQEALEQLAKVRTKTVPFVFQPQIALVCGRIFVRLNQYQKALSELQQADQIYQANGDFSGQIQANKKINTIFRDLGRYREAVSLAHSLVHWADKNDVPLLLRASCYRGLARSLAFLPEHFYEAEQAAEQALDIAKAENSLPAIGNAHLAFGEVYRHGRTFDKAVEHYQLAIDIAQVTVNRDSFLWSALGLADALLLLGRQTDVPKILNRVAEIVGRAEQRYPLEHLHWQLSETTMAYLNGRTTEDELRASAAQYSKLGINAPCNYVDTVIKFGLAIVPKPM